ncbi:MAG TPA: aldehyde dehydrogenase family protein [Paraburkholderia sp.]
MNPSTFDIISPVDGRMYSTLAYEQQSQVDDRLDRAELAFQAWRTFTLAERISAVSLFVDELERLRTRLSEEVLWLIGRPRHQSDELKRVIATVRHLMTQAHAQLGDEPIAGGDGIRRFVRREPRGVCLAICAWNYPVAMACAMVAAAMLAGNVVLLKHAPQTGPIADLIEAAYWASGAPANVFQRVHMDHPTAEQVIASGRVQFVQFIGSEQGGRAVHRAAARNLVPVGLELGGKDPAYVRPDADIEEAASGLVSGSFDNAGQSCCSVERIYVHTHVYDAFVERFIGKMRALKFGDPRGNPDVGPVVSPGAASRIRKHVEKAVAAGATVVNHPERSSIDPESAYFSPLVLLGATHAMSIMQEELFGPVAPIVRVDTDETAISLMNDSRYGLTASVWSKDEGSALAVASAVEAGTCYVNRCDHADLLLPWGGMKASGIGRSYGEAAFDELTSLKSFHVRQSH